MLYSVLKVLARPLCYVLFWPILRGKDNIPKPGPGIFALNHLGTGETFLLMALVPPHITYPAKKELFRTTTLLHRIGAWFLRALHQVPMDRAGGDASADALGSIYDVLRRGDFVGIFPEGHRSPDGRLYRGHTGVARMALTTGAPVIPTGCFRTRFTRKWLPFPWLYRPEIRIGEPLRFDEETRQAFLQAPDHEQAGQVLRTATDEVMRRIQAITGQTMVDEYSYRPRKAARPVDRPSTEKPASGEADTLVQ